MTDTTTTAPASQPAATTYLATALYSVTLKRNVEWPKGSGIMHSARKNPHKMRGSVCAEIADVIASSKPV